MDLHKVPRRFYDLLDGRSWEFRADHACWYELEELTRLPLAAWLCRVHEPVVQVPTGKLDSQGNALFTQVHRLGRVHELAFALTAGCRLDRRESYEGQWAERDIQEEFRKWLQLLPVGAEWEPIRRGCLDVLDASFASEDDSGNPEGPAETSAPPPSPESTGSAASSTPAD